MEGLSVIETQKFELEGTRIEMATAINADSQSGYVKSILNMMTLVIVMDRTS